MSRHNRTRRRPHRALTIDEQQQVAAERAKANAARYPTAPVYRTAVGTGAESTSEGWAPWKAVYETAWADIWWKAVWLVYRSPGRGFRVLHSRAKRHGDVLGLPEAQLRPNEKLFTTVHGVSRRAVIRQLKDGEGRAEAVSERPTGVTTADAAAGPRSPQAA